MRFCIANQFVFINNSSHSVIGYGVYIDILSHIVFVFKNDQVK